MTFICFYILTIKTTIIKLLIYLKIIVTLIYFESEYTLYMIKYVQLKRELFQNNYSINII